MNWSLLLLLACPLMMLFCMKGMFTGNKDSKTTAESNASQQELQQMQIKMAEMMEQNQKLMREMESKKATPSNVVELNEQQKRALS
jgi:sensor histidine kinase YesM